MSKFNKLVNQILNEFTINPEPSEFESIRKSLKGTWMENISDEKIDILLALTSDQGEDGRASLDAVGAAWGIDLNSSQERRGPDPIRKLKNRLVTYIRDFPGVSEDLKTISPDQIYIGKENDGTEYVQLNDTSTEEDSEEM